ncbi:MAG: hypothetical protein WCE64_15510, partial [Bacteroidales bacterium]
MARTKQTYIFCLDEKRIFPEDVRKRFSDPAKYRVMSFSSKKDLINSFSGEAGHAFCSVAVLSVYDDASNGQMTEEIISEVSAVDPDAGLVIVYPEARGDEIRKQVRFNVDAYIPNNNNSIFRLHNIVKKLISERNLEIGRRRRNLSFYVLLGILILSGVILLIARL